MGGPETLLGLERALRPLGIRVDRIPVLEYDPTPPSRLREAIERFGPYEVLLLTSKEAVTAMRAAGTLPTTKGGAHPRRVLAGGPTTAAALARAGVPARWTRVEGLGQAAAHPLERGPLARVVYARSDRAGPTLARTLRDRGHTVLDLVAYRVRPAESSRGRGVGSRLAKADHVLATSPSALSFLRATLGTADFHRLSRRPGLLVLGERSARAARGHGFGRVKVVRGIGADAVARALREESGRAV